MTENETSAHAIERFLAPIVGEKRANSETRHRPKWWPKGFDKRWLGERFAVMDIAPHKQPYRRHIRVKAWVCAGPNNAVHRTLIAELDLDERALNVKVNR